MKDGWHDDDYFALYESQEEAIAASARYGLSEYLPGYVAVGLKGWDDFILCDTNAKYYTVPTVPLSKEEITPYAFPAETLKLESDERFEKKIKWYVTPIVFGGSPTDKGNIVWITHEEHAEFVRWWNKLYFEVKNKTA
jgi:hypothetical protein